MLFSAAAVAHDGNFTADRKQVLRPAGTFEQGTGLQLAAPGNGRAAVIGDIEIYVAVRINVANIGNDTRNLDRLGRIELSGAVMSVGGAANGQKNRIAKES